MKTYNITITSEDVAEEVQMFQVTAEDIETLASNLEKTANYTDEIEFTDDDGEYIVISQNSEHGYNADAYTSAQAYEDGEDSIGGGLCTGTLSDAIEMAQTNR